MSITLLLKKSTPGSLASIKKHIQRAERLAEMIDEQFSINSPYKWRVKHFQWTVDALKRELTISTLYDYWLTIRVIASCLGKWHNWEPYLPNPKHKKPNINGGRKPLLSNKFK